MAQDSLRFVPLAGLLVTATAAGLMIVGADPERTASLIATVMGSTVLALWPLYAAPLNMHRLAAAFPGLCQAAMASLAVTLAVLSADKLQTALRMSIVLLPMLVIVQMLLALNFARILLAALLAVALLAPLWLGPLAALLGSNSAVAEWAIAVSPLSALAASVGCDYLRAMWFYQNSGLGASQFEYPSLAQTVSVCGAALAVLTAALLLQNRRKPAISVALHPVSLHPSSLHPSSLQESRS